MTGSNVPVCEACGRPMEPGTPVVKVGACEFPFHVHEGCRERMGPVTDLVEDLCRLAEDQPEGLLWLGSWDAGAAPAGGGEGDVREDVLRAYVAGEDHTSEAALTVLDDVLTVDGWWPAAVRLGRRTHLVRAEDDGPEPGLGAQVRTALSKAGLERLEGHFPLVEPITLQRLGLLGVAWEVWGESDADAQAALAEAAVGEGAPTTIRDAEDVARLAAIHEMGAARPQRPHETGEG